MGMSEYEKQMKIFVERARERFKYEVCCAAYVMDAIELYGRDAMPTIDPSRDNDGKWTCTDDDDEGKRIFFFLDVVDAVEFKLNFG